MVSQITNNNTDKFQNNKYKQVATRKSQKIKLRDSRPEVICKKAVLKP